MRPCTLSCNNNHYSHQTHRIIATSILCESPGGDTRLSVEIISNTDTSIPPIGMSILPRYNHRDRDEQQHGIVIVLRYHKQTLHKVSILLLGIWSNTSHRTNGLYIILRGSETNASLGQSPAWRPCVDELRLYFYAEN